jgi:hypothetical protein
MALILEDGTGITGAQSYAAYSDLVAYGALRDVTVTAFQAYGEEFLLEAMDALKDRRWKGERATATQALAWPRTGVYQDGQLLPSNEIPRELFYGQLALAIEEIDYGLCSINPSSSNTGGIELRVDSRSTTMECVNDGKVMPVAALADAEALLHVLERDSGLTLVSSVPKWKVLKR